MTQLSKKLAGLYGATLSVDTAVNGEMRVLRVTVTGLQDAFALHGEAWASLRGHCPGHGLYARDGKRRHQPAVCGH
ncbi:MAG: hypothetical protein ACLRWF_10850 [Ruthenibacterium sp.]